jgi:hypothetical protein
VHRAVLLACVLALVPTTASAQALCTFQLGFRAIYEQMPEIVGRCLENEHFNTSNGNAEQRTAAHHGQGGLLVWRKSDNWTAFTDGYWTWVNGPNGLQRRLNTETFDWERASSSELTDQEARETIDRDPSVCASTPDAARYRERAGRLLSSMCFGLYARAQLEVLSFDDPDALGVLPSDPLNEAVLLHRVMSTSPNLIVTRSGPEVQVWFVRLQDYCRGAEAYQGKPVLMLSVRDFARPGSIIRLPSGMNCPVVASGRIDR